MRQSIVDTADCGPSSLKEEPRPAGECASGTCWSRTLCYQLSNGPGPHAAARWADAVIIAALLPHCDVSSTARDRHKLPGHDSGTQRQLRTLAQFVGTTARQAELSTLGAMIRSRRRWVQYSYIIYNLTFSTSGRPYTSDCRPTAHADRPRPTAAAAARPPREKNAIRGRRVCPTRSPTPRRASGGTRPLSITLPFRRHSVGG